MSIDNIAAAIADARTRQLVANTYHSNPPVDPDAEGRAALRDLARVSMGAAVADALMATTTCSVVPLDRDTLTPTGEPFTWYDGILAHYENRYADGVGLLLGAQRDGGTLVALRAPQAAFNAWMADVGVERRTVDNGEGVVRVDASYRPCPDFVRIHWSPPSVSARVTPVAVGRAAIMAEGEKVRTDRAGVAEVGWVCWSVGAAWSVVSQPGRRLTFTNKKLTHGVEVIAAGVLPMAATRRDGWSLTSTGTPRSVDELPEWLVAALGGRWVKR